MICAYHCSHIHTFTRIYIYKCVINKFVLLKQNYLLVKISFDLLEKRFSDTLLTKDVHFI